MPPSPPPPAPDCGDPTPLLAWLTTSLPSLLALHPTPVLLASVTPHIPSPIAPVIPLGSYADPTFRAFVSAVFLADLASYPAPTDQVDFPRLLHVLSVFPQGFRLWTADVPGAGRLPVGYTGWYPIAPTSFALLERDAASLRDRMVVPLPRVDPGASFLYLFNFSVVPALRGTPAARRLMQAYAADVHAQAPRGLAAITVSPDGARVASRFGMIRTGTLTVEGCEEAVFTRRGGD